MEKNNKISIQKSLKIPYYEDISRLPITKRVQYGIEIEQIIKHILRSIGIIVENATSHEDKILKIDGFIINKNQKIPIQIKYRNHKGSDDLLMEVAQITDLNEIQNGIVYNGRDYIGQASLYIQLSQNGEEIRFCNVSKIKAEAKQLTEKLVQKYLDHGQCAIRNENGMIMITKDPFSSKKKIIFFAEVKKFCFKKLFLQESIWKLKSSDLVSS